MLSDIARFAQRWTLGTVCLVAVLACPIAAQVTVRSDHPRLLYLPDGSAGHRTMADFRQAYLQGDPRYTSYVAAILLASSGSAQEQAAKYVLTADASYAADAINAMLVSPLTYSAGDGGGGSGVEWALAYDWTWDQMTPAQQTAIESKLRKWCAGCLTDLYIGSPSEWRDRATGLSGLHHLARASLRQQQ